MTRLSTKQALHRAADYMNDHAITAGLFASADADGEGATGITLYGPIGALGSIVCSETGKQTELSSEELARCLDYSPSMLTGLMRPLRVAIRGIQDEGAVLLVDSRLGILPGIDD